MNLIEDPPTGLTEYFRRHLGSSVEILRCQRTFPGGSRDTYLIDATVGGTPEGFALRVDPVGGAACPSSLRCEYEVYRALSGSDVPVAEALWFEEGHDFVDGRPLMVRRLAEGSTSIPGISESGADGARVRRAVAFELIEKLAAVHLFDWKAARLGALFPVPVDPASAMSAELREWRRHWQERETAPDPVLEEALCWLSESVPTDTPRISLTKGNNGVGEEIWRDGKIVAMSDWEMAALGDSATDLSFSQGTFDLAPADELYRHYARCTGDDISPERMAFGAFLVWFKVLVCLRCFMMKPYVEQRHRRLNGLAFGLVFSEQQYQRLASCIGRDIVDAWRDLTASEESIYVGFAGEK